MTLMVTFRHSVILSNRADKGLVEMKSLKSTRLACVLALATLFIAEGVEPSLDEGTINSLMQDGK